MSVMSHHSRILFAAVAATIGAVSPARAQDKVTYQDHVLPVFRNACLNCHNPDKKKGGLDLSTYAGIMAGGGTGKAIEPGDPDGSLLFRLVNHAEEPAMPPKGDKLPGKELDLVKRWIAAGVLENSGSSAVVSDKPKLDLTVAAGATGKPDGPPPMPGDLLLEPPVHTARPGAVLAMAASPWAPLVAVGGQKQVLLYNPQTRELLGVLPFPEGFPNVLRFSRSGKLLLVAGGVGAKSGKAVLFDVTTGGRVTEVGDELDAVLAADISPDQSVVALGGPGKVVKLYSTANGAMVAKIKKHTDWVTAIAFSPDGVLLATGDRNGGLVVWEAESANELYALPGHKAAVTDAAFRADSNVLATSGEDGDVRLWDMRSGKPVKEIKAHAGGALSVDFAPDGRLVSAGRDNRLRSWKPDGAALKAYDAFGDVALHAVFDHGGGGKLAVGGDWAGELRVYGVDDGKLLGTLDANPPTLAERLSREDAKLAEVSVAHDKLAAQLAAAEQEHVTATIAERETTSFLAILRQSIGVKAENTVQVRKSRDATAQALAAAAEAARARRAGADERLQAAVAAAAAQNAAAAEYDAAAADVAAKQSATSAALDAAAKAKAAAEAAPTNAALGTAAADARASAEQAASQLADAGRALGTKFDQLKTLGEAAAKSLADAASAAGARNAADASFDAARLAADRAAGEVVAAEQALAAARAAVAAAEADLPKRGERVKQLAEAVARLKPRVDEAWAAASAAKVRVARLRAGQFFSEVYAARQALAEAQRAAEAAERAAAASQAGAESAAAAVPDFEKRMAEFPQRIVAAERAVPLAEQTAAAAGNMGKEMAALAGAREAFVTESASHAAKVAQLAANEPENKRLADAAAASKSAADLLGAELEKLKAAVAAQDKAAKSATDALAAARSALEKERLDANRAPETLEQLRAAVPAARSAADAARATADAAAKRLAEAKSAAEQLETRYAELKKQLGLTSVATAR